MEFNKTVSNPMLVGCIELIKAEDTPEHRKMFVDELIQANMMAPVLMEPQPVEGPDGKLRAEPGTKVQFPMLSAPDGKKFFMAFTDASEYEAWQEKVGQKQHFFALKFDDYAAMLLRRDSNGNVSPALGFVINPVGANLVVPRGMVANIMAMRIAQARQAATKNAGGQVLRPAPATQKAEEAEEKND